MMNKRMVRTGIIFYALSFLLLVLFAAVSTGCASSRVAQVGAEINDQAREGAEFTLCNGISVGAWRRAYGDNPGKTEGWRALCQVPDAAPIK